MNGSKLQPSFHRNAPNNTTLILSHLIIINVKIPLNMSLWPNF